MQVRKGVSVRVEENSEMMEKNNSGSSCARPTVLTLILSSRAIAHERLFSNHPILPRDKAAARLEERELSSVGHPSSSGL